MLATIPVYDVDMAAALIPQYIQAEKTHVTAKLVDSDSSSDFVVNSDTFLVNPDASISDVHSSEINTLKLGIFDNIVFPDSWGSEGVARPNVASKSRSFEICKQILLNHSLLPNKIAPTKEEGVYLSYEDKVRNKSLIIEVYNNLEVAAVVINNQKKVIEYSEDIYGLQLVDTLKAFSS